MFDTCAYCMHGETCPVHSEEFNCANCGAKAHVAETDGMFCSVDCAENF